MQVEIKIANESAAGRNYLTWAPVRGTLQLTAGGGRDPVRVTLTSGGARGQRGGRLEFAAKRDDRRTTELDLMLPASGAAVEFFVAGVFGKPSTADRDTTVEVTRAGTRAAVATKPVMVRIRKNANSLIPAERDRFTTALARLNDRGAGLFRDFREMHRQRLALAQAHGAPGFLSWHRAYLLDLERELQRIDPSVTLPYWRFDEPAPNVFSANFMGASGPSGNVLFSPTNLLRQWQTDEVPGISRRPRFRVATQGASVSDQATTLSMGGLRPNAIFDLGPDETGVDRGGFDSMEGDPHGFAHTSFDGWIRSPGTAPRDPLFFLLHCNVDRLWARWQWFNDRFDGARADTYFYRGQVGSNPATFVGHNLLDTMWPWNNVTGGDRPPIAPRTPFPQVPTAQAPAGVPTVRDLIDYQGFLDAGSYTGFGYDDVPYGVAP